MGSRTRRSSPETTGIEVRVDAEGWEDVRPKAAVAANIGSGPDIIIGTFEDAHQYPDKLVDVSDLANYLGAKYGGWYDVCKAYCTTKGQVDRDSDGLRRQRDRLPRKPDARPRASTRSRRTLAGFLKLMPGAEGQGHCRRGFALGNATGDGNSWCHWLVWAFGGKMVDEKNNVVINSPETITALEYAKQLYETFIPGTLSWLDPNNNKAFLDGQISLTNNGISIYYAAKTSPDPKLQEIAKDIQHANFPIGRSGRPTELHLFFPMMVFKYSKYPNAAKEYLRFMMEKEQYDALAAGVDRLRDAAADGLRIEPDLDRPIRSTRRTATLMKMMLPNGYAGKMGYASAAAMADFIMVNMVAEAASGSKTPKEAAERAQKRAERYYKV